MKIEEAVERFIPKKQKSEKKRKTKAAMVEWNGRI